MLDPLIRNSLFCNYAGPEIENHFFNEGNKVSFCVEYLLKYLIYAIALSNLPEIQSKTAMVLEKFHGNGKYSKLAAHLSMMDHQVFYRWKNSTILGGCQQPG